MRTAIRYTSVLARPILHAFSFAILTAFAAWVEVPLYPVPITMQTCAVLLSGALLGAYWGTVSQAIYLVGGLFLPIYAGGAMGVATLFGATGGYLLSFPLAAFLVGLWLRHISAETSLYSLFARLFTISLMVMVIGTIWLQAVMKLSVVQAILVGFVPFIAGDIIKCALVTAIVKADLWLTTYKPH